MNTPEQAGATLARDMIALVESHFQLNDDRMIATNGMMGAFLYLEEHIYMSKYQDDKETGLAIHNAFGRVYYCYMRDCIKNAVQLDDDAKNRLLENNQMMMDIYCT